MDYTNTSYDHSPPKKEGDSANFQGRTHEWMYLRKEGPQKKRRIERHVRTCLGRHWQVKGRPRGWERISNSSSILCCSLFLCAVASCEYLILSLFVCVCSWWWWSWWLLGLVVVGPQGTKSNSLSRLVGLYIHACTNLCNGARNLANHRSFNDELGPPILNWEWSVRVPH